MTRKPAQMRTDDTILIPELEEAMQSYRPREWTRQEEAIVSRYYGKVPLQKLADHLPGRTRETIRNKAARMGLVGGKK